MILGIGIDSVDISRFDEYHTHDHTFLEKLFSPQEIAYCLSQPKPAQHFASRFAAREAFFKAHQAMLFTLGQQHPATLLTVVKHLQITHNERGLPLLDIDWHALLSEGVSAPKAHISLTHTSKVATAFVILEQA